MGRPVKNSADFFSHDAGMRNHRKIKAVRTKFGITGYAVWCMLLEHMTGSDGNEFENSEVEFELLAGDFGVSVAEIRDVVYFCIKMELLFENNGFIYSETLNERLAPVYQKRGKARELSKKQRRVNGHFVTNNTESSGISVAETPQSKVKESKVKEITKTLRAFEVPFVDGSPAFEAWQDWEKYRKEIKKKLTPSTAKKQIQFLGGRADPEIIGIINQSITQGWQGLFELKSKNQQYARPTNKRSSDAVIETGHPFGSF